MPRLFTALFALLLVALTTGRADAQNHGLSSPVAWNAAVGSDFGDRQQSWILGSLDIPLEEWLPQTTPDSRIRLAGLRVAYHTEEGASDLRIQAQVLDLLLQRAWWSGKVRLMDLNRTGLADIQDTWFEFGTGPGVHSNSTAGAISARAMILGGRKRWNPGPDYPETAAGWHGGIAFMVAARFRQQLELSVSAERLALSGTGASWWSSRAEGSWQFAGNLTFGMHAERLTPVEGGQWGQWRQTDTRAGASLMYRVH